MKVISIKQPWAYLIIKKRKKYEFRTWKTKYKGEILIHASKTIDKEAVKRFNLNIKDLETGKILGITNITDCIVLTKELKEELLKKEPEIYKNSKIGEYAFKLENTKEFDIKKELKGKLGIFNI